MTRRVDRVRLNRLERRLDHAAARHPPPPPDDMPGRRCAACNRLYPAAAGGRHDPDPDMTPAPGPWPWLTWPACPAAGGAALCVPDRAAAGAALPGPYCGLVIPTLAYYLAQDVSWTPCPSTRGAVCPFPPSAVTKRRDCRQCSGLDHATLARRQQAYAQRLVALVRSDPPTWRLVLWALDVDIAAIHPGFAAPASRGAGVPAAAAGDEDWSPAERAELVGLVETVRGAVWVAATPAARARAWPWAWSHPTGRRWMGWFGPGVPGPAAQAQLAADAADWHVRAVLRCLLAMELRLEGYPKAPEAPAPPQPPPDLDVEPDPDPAALRRLARAAYQRLERAAMAAAMAVVRRAYGG
jgi:hypothetical protein